MKSMESRKQQKNVPPKYVFVSGFEYGPDGKAVGIKGYVWPDKKPVSVELDMDCEKAKSNRRRSFAEWEKGFRTQYGPKKLEVGAMLRLRLYPTENEGRLKTDWINVISHDREETDRQLRFGYVVGKVRTPRDVYEKRQELCRDPKVRARISLEYERAHPGKKLSEMDYQAGIERILSDELSGKPRYYMSYYFYDPKRIMVAKNREELGASLLKYFGNPEFTPIESTSGNPYRPVKPYLCIRFLDSEGRYTGKHMEFSRGDDCEVTGEGEDRKVRFLTPEECVETVLHALPDGSFNVSVLPGQIYTHSIERMLMGQNKDNDHAIRQAYRLNNDSHVESADGDGARYQAFNMGLKVSAGGTCVVTEMVRDYAIPGVDPVLINGMNRVLEVAEPHESHDAAMTPGQ